MSDIRKWFMKQHDKGYENASKPEKVAAVAKSPPPHTVAEPVKAMGAQESLKRKKTSRYFDSTSSTPIKGKCNDGGNAGKSTEERKKPLNKDALQDKSRHLTVKRTLKDDDDDFLLPCEEGLVDEISPAEKLKGELGSVSKKSKVVTEDVECMDEVKLPSKSGGRGVGVGRGRGTTGAGAGRAGVGRGRFMNFGERKDPPHKGEKELPVGSPDCLAGLTFVISGTLDSLEREEAEDLIKRHGGRVTGSVSKRTNYLLADEDVGGLKSSKAKELGIPFLTEDGLFDMVRASKPTEAIGREELKQTIEAPQSKNYSLKAKVKEDGKSLIKKCAEKDLLLNASTKQKVQTTVQFPLLWTEKYKPKVLNDMVGNQSIVKQLQHWLTGWDEQFLRTRPKGNVKKNNDSASKKAVLLSGSPGIGKTTSAKLVSQMLGFKTVEVNASDSRGKADSKIMNGIAGKTSNSIKELVSNEALTPSLDCSKHSKLVLIMDEVDGMSAGDRGGIADLIASIKLSKFPIICICNDRYSQKLKSLVNYCLLLNFKKPTKQQMAKRLLQVANAEGLKINEIALEELADRVNGDMRMALNQLQYMSLSHSIINYDDIRRRLLTSPKDEYKSPFSAVDKLFHFNGAQLRMDERIDLSMSDPDLVPLIIQENYINYRPRSTGKDESGVQRMNMIARAAESIADGDIINVQIRRFRQWQLSQFGCFASSIIPAALMQGQRESLLPGEQNYNRFGGWLGKNSTMGKNLRLLEDLHVHVLASRESIVDRVTLRIDFLSLFLKKLTKPLRELPKDVAVQNVVEFMDAYSLSQDDYDTVLELSKLKGHPNPLEGVQPAVKSALTIAYKQSSSSRVIRAADLVTLPGLKKAPKKRIAAILEPLGDVLGEGNDDALTESEEENSLIAEDPDAEVNGDQKPQIDLQSYESKGIRVEVNARSNANSKEKAARKTKASTSAGKGGRSSGGNKRKR